MVPTRFVVESLGAKVNWNSSTRTVVVSTQSNGVSSKVNSNSYEECTKKETYLDENDFRYFSYSCKNIEQYTDLGNHILSLLNSDGILFLQDSNEDVWDYEFDFEFQEDEELLVTYTVDQGKLTDPILEDTFKALQGYQKDIKLHEDNWKTFIRLIPKEHLTDVVEYIVFAHDQTSGFVLPYTYHDNVTTNWGFGINILDIEPKLERISTSIHEFAHIYTLGKNQITPYILEENCDQLFLSEGCSKADAYIQKFYEEFWVDIYEEVLSFDSDPDLMTDFYLSREDQFVNDYAATSLGEDIAETFAYFVLQPKPTGNTIMEKKIRFFYKYPELIQLRAEILSRLYFIVSSETLK
jgi:hypothetical protein